MHRCSAVAGKAKVSCEYWLEHMPIITNPPQSPQLSKMAYSFADIVIIVINVVNPDDPVINLPSRDKVYYLKMVI